MGFHYNADAAMLETALTFGDTIVNACFQRFEFWMLVATNCGIWWCWQHGVIDRHSDLLDLQWDHMKVSAGLLTFFIVFYTNQTFSRYTRLYELTRGILSLVIEITSEMQLRIFEAPSRRKSMKYIYAGVSVFFFDLVVLFEDDTVAWPEVTHLPTDNFLTEREQQYLMQYPGSKSFLVLHWGLMDIRKQLGPPRERYLKSFEDKVYKIRQNSQDIVDILNLPMPFPYYHILNVMLTMNLSLWAWTMGCHDSALAPLIFFVSSLIFLGMKELAADLSNPFGTDSVDFPTDLWLCMAYNSSVQFIEHSEEFKLELEAEELWGASLVPLSAADMVDEVARSQLVEEAERSPTRSFHNALLRDSDDISEAESASHDDDDDDSE
mmetsp:Transcript_780/g.1579  ORF Transcript_780/g.1579 Transcript_780/m.1579 type:complete len:380 (-) Transcript_780:5-1144(-)